MEFTVTSQTPIAFTVDVAGGEGGRLPDYDGTYTVTPKAATATVLATKNKSMTDDVTVTKIPYYETSNPQNGLTAYIANEL